MVDEFDGVEAVSLLPEGGYVLTLSKPVEGKSKIVVTASVSEMTHRLRWSCKTDIKQTYLGPPQTAICQHDASI